MRKVLWITVLMAFSCLPDPPEPQEVVDCDLATGYFLAEIRINPAISSFYYDDNGRFIAMKFKPGQRDVEEVTRTEFTYDGDGLLKEVNDIRVTTSGTRIVTARSFYYFDLFQRLIATKRLSTVQGTLQPLDSIAISYLSDEFVSRADIYDGKTKELKEYQAYTYIEGIIKVEYRRPPAAVGGQPVDDGTSEYKVDKNKRPYPKQFEYYLIANKFPSLPANVINHRAYGGPFTDESTTTNITYNSDGLPINDGREYVYKCEPQRE